MFETKLIKLVEKESATPEQIEKLIESGIDVNFHDKWTESALITAVKKNSNPEITRKLLELGADPMIEDKLRYNALDCAAMYNSKPEIAGLLVEACRDCEDFEDLLKDALRFSAECNANFRVWEVFWLALAQEEESNLTIGISEAICTAARKNENYDWLDVFSYLNLPIDLDFGQFGLIVDYDEPTQEYSYEFIDDEKTDPPQTVLHLAAEENPSFLVIQDIVVRSMALETFNPQEINVLNRAVLNENVKILRFLVEQGFEVEPDDEDGPYQDSALTVLARKGSSPEAVALLVKAGADLEEKDVYGKTPLMLAAAENPEAEVVRSFLEFYPDRNYRTSTGETALLVAAKSNPNPEVIEMLIEEGFDVRARDKEPSSCNSLELALKFNRNPAVADVLIRHFPELLPPEQQNQSYPDYLLERISEKALDSWTDESEEDFYNVAFSKLISSDNLEVLGRLFAKIKDVDTMNWESLTPLMWAAMNCETTEKLELLVKFGAKPNKLNEDQYTPLMKAAKFNDSLAVIKYLLQIGAKVNLCDNDKWSALHFAAQKNSNPEIIKALIQAGAKVDKKDNDGWTPLMIAAMENPEPAIIKTLLEAGAKIHFQDEDGWDALDWAARENRNPEVIKLLLMHEVRKNGLNLDLLKSLLELTENNLEPKVHEEMTALLAPIIEKMPVKKCKTEDLEKYATEIKPLQYFFEREDI